MTEQKEIREEISRVSSRTIAKVQEETGALRQLLSAVESGVQRNGVSVERLKRETSEVRRSSAVARLFGIRRALPRDWPSHLRLSCQECLDCLRQV